MRESATPERRGDAAVASSTLVLIALGIVVWAAATATVNLLALYRRRPDVSIALTAPESAHYERARRALLRGASVSRH